MMNFIPLLRILADDVTGAADCAARCKNAGLPATILLQPPTGPLPTGAVSLSSDSRYLAPVAAAERVRQLCLALHQADAQTAGALWYKKIDSTLRGNIGAELAAMLTLTTATVTHPCAVVAPAFPAQGRGLVDGYLVYDQAPPHAAHLPTLLQQQSTLPLATVALPIVRAGVAHLAATLTAHSAVGAQLFVADAVTEADLETIYQATRVALPQALFCGSAGLIGVIAAALVQAQDLATPPLSTLPTAVGRPLLAVVGSGSPMAHRQVAQLLHRMPVDRCEVDPQRAELAALPTLPPQHPNLVLHLPQPLPGAPLEGAVARRYAAALATVAVTQIAQRRPQTLLVVGGDTAVHLLSLLGITALAVQAEVLPGMPLTIGQAADGRRYQIILKAGNHGDEETLVTLFAA